MTLIEFFEISARGGAAALCVTLTIQLLSLRPLRPASLFGTFFLIGAATYSVVALPTISGALGSYIIPFKLIGMMSPAFFWLFITAIHDDNFRWRHWLALPPLTIGALYLVCIPFPQASETSKLIQIGVVTILMGLTIHTVRCCYSDDLVASRRHFGRVMRYLVPLIAIAIIGIEILETFEFRHPAARLTVATSILVVGIVLATSISTLRKTLIPTATDRSHTLAKTGELSAADRIDLGRLRDLMEEGAFMNAGLSIGELAKQMSVPEHRLRKLINSGLGYRNFAAFINDHRIDEAKRRLARPKFAREQITGLAFDLGYTSLAPFNRAFRERTGKSPTEYREKMLNDPSS